MSKLFCLPSEKGSVLGGANSCLLGQIPFQKGMGCRKANRSQKLFPLTKITKKVPSLSSSHYIYYKIQEAYKIQETLF